MESTTLEKERRHIRTDETGITFVVLGGPHPRRDLHRWEHMFGGPGGREKLQMITQQAERVFNSPENLQFKGDSR